MANGGQLFLVLWKDVTILYSLGTTLFVHLHIRTDNDNDGVYMVVVVVVGIDRITMTGQAKVNADSVLYLLPGPAV